MIMRNQKDKLKSEINLDRDFHTELEHLMMSIVYTHESLMKLSNQFLSQYGISVTQLNALMSIYDYYQKNQVSLSQKELAVRLLINKASAGTLCDRLQKNGWVKLNQSTLDKRAKEVSLTDEGYLIFEKVFIAYYEFMWALRDGVSEKEISTVLKVQQKIRDNMSKLSDGLLE